MTSMFDSQVMCQSPAEAPSFLTARSDQAVPDRGTPQAMCQSPADVPSFLTARSDRTFQERGFPHTTFPIGWFQVAWSEEFATGKSYPLRYFDTDLVAYRGESGEVHILDGHCPHLGAHLGCGGMVQGDDISCPFHGWKFDENGRNIDIPYSERGASHRSVRPWPVRENSGAVMVWHHPEGDPPSWELPDPLVVEAVNPDFYHPFPHTARYREVAAPPQWVAENAVDLVHLQYVHRNPPAKGGSMLEPTPGAPHVLGVDIDASFETARGEVAIRARNEVFGLGVVVNHLFGLTPTAQLECVTPIDHTKSVLRFTVYVPLTEGDERSGPPTSLSKAVADAEMYEVFGPDRDFPIWENQHFVAGPALTKEEAELYGAFRRWAKQFYIS
jgi:3-ketosteroid 9alpha-monooxygenase subunit A